MGSAGSTLFEAVDLATSGVVLTGEVRALVPFSDARGRSLMLVARNDARPLLMRYGPTPAQPADAPTAAVVVR
jgi:hypothetical protein